MAKLPKNNRFRYVEMGKVEGDIYYNNINTFVLEDTKTNVLYLVVMRGMDYCCMTVLVDGFGKPLTSI